MALAKSNLGDPTILATSSAWRKWWICGLLLLATTLNYMDRMALNQTAKEIQADFGLNNEQYGWVEGAFAAAFAIGAIAIGWLVDRGNVRWIYPLIVLGWSFAGFLTGYASSFWMLLSCRVMLGFFEAGNWPCGIRTTRTVLKPEERSLGNAMFQSGTALGAILTPLVVLACLQWSDDWRFPFRVIGAIGIFWVVLWWMSLQERDFQPVETATTSGSQEHPNYWTLWTDRRFWLLIVLITAVNTPWHTLRVWMPKYLQEYYGISRENTMYFSAVYYLLADIGSLTVGFLTLYLARRGLSVFASRMRMLLLCALLTLLLIPLTWLMPFDTLPALGLLLCIGFAALGLFPTYFAFSQELSGRHQGKVTGTLGALNGLYLAAVFPVQGRIVDAFGYGPVLVLAAFPPLLAYGLLRRYWPNDPSSRKP